MQKKFFAGLITTVIAFTGLFHAQGVILPPPPSKTIALSWSYPEVNTQIVFNVYATTNLAVPIDKWTLITNVSSTSCVLPAQFNSQFFTVAASNTVTKLQSAFASN